MLFGHIWGIPQPDMMPNGMPNGTPHSCPRGYVLGKFTDLTWLFIVFILSDKVMSILKNH
jgi:hypothetical protein